MRRALLIAVPVVLLGALAVLLLRSRAPASPEAVLGGFLDALARGDYDRAAAQAEGPLTGRKALVRIRFALRLDTLTRSPEPQRSGTGWRLALPDGAVELRATMGPDRVRDLEPVDAIRPPPTAPSDLEARAADALHGLAAGLRSGEPDAIARHVAWPLRDSLTAAELSTRLRETLPDEPVLGALTTAPIRLSAPATAHGAFLRAPLAVDLPGGGRFEVSLDLLPEGGTWRVAALAQ